MSARKAHEYFYLLLPEPIKFSNTIVFTSIVSKILLVFGYATIIRLRIASKFNNLIYGIIRFLKKVGEGAKAPLPPPHPSTPVLSSCNEGLRNS
jgi:hypothetical protein